MNQEKESFNNTIGLIYMQGTLDDDDLLQLTDELEFHQLAILYRENPSRYLMGIEEFFPQIRAFLSSDIVQNICQNLASSAIFEGIKAFIITLRRSASKKRIARVQSNKIETNVSPTIQLCIGDVNITIPADIDDEKLKHCLDKVFEYINDQSVVQETYLVYSERTGKFECYTRRELMHKKHEEHQSENKQ